MMSGLALHNTQCLSATSAAGCHTLLVSNYLKSGCPILFPLLEKGGVKDSSNPRVLYHFRSHPFASQKDGAPRPLTKGNKDTTPSPVSPVTDLPHPSEPIFDECPLVSGAVTMSEAHTSSHAVVTSDAPCSTMTASNKHFWMSWKRLESNSTSVSTGTCSCPSTSTS